MKKERWRECSVCQGIGVGANSKGVHYKQLHHADSEAGLVSQTQTYGRWRKKVGMRRRSNFADWIEAGGSHDSPLERGGGDTHCERSGAGCH